MLQPKQTKFRKMHKGRNRGLAQNGNTVAFGRFGLVASDRGRITARQIEAARRAMTRHIKRGGNIWIRIFPDKPITKKPFFINEETNDFPNNPEVPVIKIVLYCSKYSLYSGVGECVTYLSISILNLSFVVKVSVIKSK